MLIVQLLVVFAVFAGGVQAGGDNDTTIDGYLSSMLYGDANCGIIVAQSKLISYGQCNQEYTNTVQNVTGSYKLKLALNTTVGEEYKVKKVNFASVDCTGRGHVAVVVPERTLGLCEPAGGSYGGNYATLKRYTDGPNAPFLSAYGLTYAYYNSYLNCQADSPDTLSTETIYQDNACQIVNPTTGADYSQSFTCTGTGFTKTIYSDTLCQIEMSSVTQPFPTKCQDKTANVDNTLEAWETISCKLPPTASGWLKTTVYNAASCAGGIAKISVQGLGMCFQKWNATAGISQGGTSYRNVYHQHSATGYNLISQNFDDSRCTFNQSVGASIPGTQDTCMALGGANNVGSQMTEYVDGPTKPTLTMPNGGIFHTYFATPETCVQGTPVSYESIYNNNACIQSNDISYKYSYDGTNYVKNTYSDKLCTSLSATTSVTTPPVCKDNTAALNNNQQAYETLIWSAPAAGAPVTTKSGNGLTMGDGEIAGTFFGVFFFAVIITSLGSYFMNKAKMDKLEKSAANSGLDLGGINNPVSSGVSLEPKGGRNNQI